MMELEMKEDILKDYLNVNGKEIFYMDIIMLYNIKVIMKLKEEIIF